MTGQEFIIVVIVIAGISGVFTVAYLLGVKHGRRAGSSQVQEIYEERLRKGKEKREKQLDGAQYQRIYHQTDYPGTLSVASTKHERKHQDPKHCTTVGWVVSRGTEILGVVQA